MEKKPELSFRPLSSGLGFHPYEPVTKPSAGQPPNRPLPVGTHYSAGVGAVAAGRPTFLLPERPQTVTAVPPPVKHEPLLEAGHEFGFGYALKRAAAFLLDSSLNLGLCSLALLASLWKQGLNLELLVNPGVALLVALFMTAFNWAVITAQEVAFGTSIGKRVFKLALDGPISIIFLRSVLFLLSLGLGGLGVIWALFDKKKRCWHDVVVDVQPIELARL